MAFQMTREPVLAPRATSALEPWASRMTARLSRFCNTSWRVMESMGQRRAERELRRLAATRSHQPDFARQLRAAADRLAQPGD